MTQDAGTRTRGQDRRRHRRRAAVSVPPRRSPWPRDGWTVVLAGRRRGALDAGRRERRRAARCPRPVPGRRHRRGVVRALFDGAVDRHGRVDLLFNNAGMGAPARDLDDDPAGRVAGGGRGEPDRGVPVHPGGVPGDAPPATRRAAGSSTTARSPRTRRGRGRSPTPRPSTRSPG